MHEEDVEKFKDDPPRRGFIIQFLTGAIGACGFGARGAGNLVFLNPIAKKKDSAGAKGKRDEDGFVLLAGVTVESLPEDGTPVACKVFDDKIDAWNRFSNVEIGTVWIRRLDENNILAFSSICPHLGCAVDYRQTDRDFFCPCHTSSFDLEGNKTNSIPPRGMDQLQVKTKPDTGDQIWLKYETFHLLTIAEKIPVS
ncbi:MAG: Rieske 2Fe-2S domain-containing protein [Pirellulaceae bacterium]